jgi:hypothetical protein
MITPAHVWKLDELAAWRAKQPVPLPPPPEPLNLSDPWWDFLDQGAEDKMKLKEAIP